MVPASSPQVILWHCSCCSFLYIAINCRSCLLSVLHFVTLCCTEYLLCIRFDLNSESNCLFAFGWMNCRVIWQQFTSQWMACRMDRSRQNVTSSNSHTLFDSSLWIFDEYHGKPSVLWHCWLGIRKSIWSVKIKWWGVGVVICPERGADCLRIVRLMPLPSQNSILSCHIAMARDLFTVLLTAVLCVGQKPHSLQVGSAGLASLSAAHALGWQGLLANTFRKLARVYSDCVVDSDRTLTEEHIVGHP